MIRAVFFDVGETLIRPTPSMGEIYSRVLGPLGVRADPEQYRTAFRLTWDEMTAEAGPGGDRFHRHSGGEMGYWRTYVGRVLGRLSDRAGARRVDVEAAMRQLHDTFAEPVSWRVFPDVRKTLAILRERRLLTGVISNWDSRLPALLEGLGLEPLFDVIIYSSAAGGTGIEKPSPGIFHHALERLGAAPGESLHVGDDLSADYRGAIGAGMRGILLVREGVAPDGIDTVKSLAELPALCESQAV